MSPPPPPGQDPGAPGTGAPPPWSAHLEDLGQLLRRSRESQGLTAESVADRLRIGVEQLEALETADLERLPEPVFVIAQARRVAGALKLDIEPQLAALRATADRGPAGARPPARTLTAPQPDRQRRSWTAPLALGGVLLAGAAGWALWRQLGPTTPAASPSSISQPASPPPEPPPATPRPRPAQPTAESTTLVLESAQPGWVQVRQSDGTSLFKGLLQGSRSFPIGQGLEVLAGRPDLVRAQWHGGSPQPLGAISDVRWRRFAPQR